jgi:peptidyl-tRNA hydrolase, PTH1 family
VVGLGNPGDRYQATRHNVGFRVVDELAAQERIAVRRLEGGALLGRGAIGGEPILLARPQTFMNASGEAVRVLCQKYDVDLDRLCVVCDDADLPLGRLRFRARGSSGGHKGLQSTIASLGSFEFPRLRIGIAGPSDARDRDLAEYVLEPFEPEERPVIEEAVGRAREAIVRWVTRGIDAAMLWTNTAPE